MDCAFREVREALMPLHTCDVVASDRFTVHRECATNLHSTRLYIPSDFWQRRTRRSLRRLACARQFFDEQHCAQLASRHCAVTSPWQTWDVTVAKSISFATFLGFQAAARGGVRCALSDEQLASWSWRPRNWRHNATCDEPSAWWHGDACLDAWWYVERGPTTPHARAEAALRPLRQHLASTNASTAAAFWWAGQLLRGVRKALGGCGAAARDRVLQHRIVQHPLQGSDRLDGAALTVAMHIRRDDRYRASNYWAQATAIVTRLLAQPRKRAAAEGGTALRIIVATDADAAPAELREAVTRGGLPAGVARVAIEHLALDRDRLFLDRTHAAYGRGRDVALGSLLADLELLSRAEIFVGTSASWTSRLALLAIIGELGAIPPFALLDAPLRCVWCAA